MLQIITGCFSGSGGGVPELGLGNAEVVVMYSAWSLVRVLYKNATWFKRASDLLQFFLWTLAIVSCISAIISSGALDKYLTSDAPQADDGDEESGAQSLLSFYANKAIIFLPIITAFFTTVSGRMQWRDKWSICYTAKFQITAEIYYFRSEPCVQNATLHLLITC